jgi:hypothetical protein
VELVEIDSHCLVFAAPVITSWQVLCSLLLLSFIRG